MGSIFSRQKELIEKYIEIEGMPKGPWDLNNAGHQSWIKDFFWRITEELCEAQEYLVNGDAGPLFLEEISDALHFLVEVMIMLGVSEVDVEAMYPKDKNGDPLDLDKALSTFVPIIEENQLGFSGAVFGIVYDLGLAANCLKNKSWKQTQMITDVSKFRHHLFMAFISFLVMCKVLGIDAAGIYTIYMKKASVNQFRQETKY
jgi:dimeric dUTPase (all-alpha-NTP-PPase superfamily)